MVREISRLYGAQRPLHCCEASLSRAKNTQFLLSRVSGTSGDNLRETSISNRTVSEPSVSQGPGVGSWPFRCLDALKLLGQIWDPQKVLRSEGWKEVGTSVWFPVELHWVALHTQWTTNQSLSFIFIHSSQIFTKCIQCAKPWAGNE